MTEKRWTIRKATAAYGGSADAPFDSKEASIIGRDVDAVEVVPAQVAERLAETLDDLYRAFNRMPDAMLKEDDPRYGWWMETFENRKAALAALADFRSQHG